MKDSILNQVLGRMAEGYEEQLPLYAQMYVLAQEQEVALQQAEVDTDQLVELINSRQDLINSVEELNVEITQLKGEVCTALKIEEFSLSRIKASISGTGVEDLEKVVGRLALLLQKIKELDQTNEETLRRRLKETKDKLTEVQNKKKANKAYQKKAPARDGVFVDFSK